MKYIIGILFIGLLAACSDLVRTDAEAKAVQKVLDFYGGACIQKKGVATKNGKTTKYFELEMSKSELLESYEARLEMPASNIAYLFYSNLGNEQKNFTHIRVKITLAKGEVYEQEFPVEDLKKIETFVPILQTTSDRIKAKEYEKLLSEFDTTIAKGLSDEQLKSYCSPYDSAYGEVKKTQFQGYSYFVPDKDPRVLVHLAGVMIREKENTPISLFVDLETEKVVTMKFEF